MDCFVTFFSILFPILFRIIFQRIGGGGKVGEGGEGGRWGKGGRGKGGGRGGRSGVPRPSPRLITYDSTKFEFDVSSLPIFVVSMYRNLLI